MKHFLVKNSLYFTTAVAVGAIIYLVLRWSDLSVSHRLVCFLLVAITLHEWEEMLFGFEEKQQENFGLAEGEGQEGVGKILLLLLTLYVGIVPLVFTNIVWMPATFFVLGIAESFAHISTFAKMGKKKTYDPGMVTAFTLCPILGIVGFYFLISGGLMQPIWWLFAVLNLFIPLITFQVISVKSTGAKYSDFLKNTRASFSRRNAE